MCKQKKSIVLILESIKSKINQTELKLPAILKFMKSPSPQNPSHGYQIPENQIQGWQTADRPQNCFGEINKLENDQDKLLRSNLLFRVIS